MCLTRFVTDTACECDSDSVCLTVSVRWGDARGVRRRDRFAHVPYLDLFACVEVQHLA